MTFLQALILGIVQGLTEYVPVSSSAHLVLVPQALHWNLSPDVAFVFGVLVQLGTLAGVLVYFFSDIKAIVMAVITGLINRKPFGTEDARLGFLVAFATIPATVLGLMFKSQISAFFSDPTAALKFLLVTATLLVVAELVTRTPRELVKTSDALFIGFAQAASLFPGLSRSGSTISAGVYCGLSKRAAARFSFLMSIPVMVGASLIAGKDLLESTSLLHELAWPLLVGFCAAAITGYLVIRWFMDFLRNQSLLWFAAYCALAGTIGLLLS